MRSNLLAHVRRVVIKIGSGVLSDPQGIEPAQIAVIADQVALLRQKGYEVIIVSSGAVSAGKGYLGIAGRPATIPLKQAAAAIGQTLLMRTWGEAFHQYGLKVAQVLLTRDDLANRRRYLNSRNTLMTLLDHRIIPIINENDTVVIDEIRFGDNDNLSALVSSLVEANLLVILSDVSGLYDRDPRTDAAAELIPCVERINDEIIAMAGSSGTDLGTGGMATKIKAAKRASLSGIGTAIINGRVKDSLLAFFAGDEIGTLFLPARDRLTAKKHWIAFSKKTRGKLIVDEGARCAMVERGKSLLPSGIIGVEGGFDRGDAVRLSSADGSEIATGVINYSLTELLRIMGHKSSEIETILGYKYADEVVHRDNLVLKTP
ncbi:MAG: glutamate 5-kinase [Deltaproteobacteria bacterium HGW-Deltaproteobacteria-4]|nr:MAG: glutamate 5-kinase [Deltaproteobacteria bacterium HGW-Deltaproteobacteria-4]